MKNTTFVLLCLVAVLAACGGDSSSSGGTTAAGPGAEQPGPEQPTPEGGGALSGAAQKGPFQAGATARLQRLVNGAVDSDAAALETTVDERGRYAFPETGFFGPALLTVSGFWFDEAEGRFSGEPVTLSAVVLLEEGEQAADANVNVLTDLISERLMAELAEHNDDYAAALASLMPDYRELTGLRRPPGQLDMLAGFIPGETLEVGLTRRCGCCRCSARRWRKTACPPWRRRAPALPGTVPTTRTPWRSGTP